MFDLLIVGGGINGCAIARDAAGRGLSVLLVEQGDLACVTSSASTKLIHGGLRYLELYEFRLVHEALVEREVLLASAPHLVRPLKFVLPHEPGLRPAWMIRLGLFLYDHLARRKRLEGSRMVSLRGGALGGPLRENYSIGFTYADCAVDDARLVVANAIAARELGARIRVGTKLAATRREADRWIARVESAGGPEEIEARAIVNAAGPYVSRVAHDLLRITSRKHARLVKGSHIVTRKLYDGEHAYILQNPDKRIVFAIPYEQDFTLVGTTDIAHQGAPAPVAISDAETDYLLASINRCFSRAATRDDIVWSYAGLRPLFDDGAIDARDPAVRAAPRRDKLGSDADLRAEFARGDRVGDDETSVVDPAIGVGESDGIALAQRLAERAAPQRDHMRALQTLAPREVVVKKQPEPDHPGGAQTGLVRQHEFERPHEMRRGGEHHFPLDQRLVD